MTLSDGTIRTFEVPVDKFHDLRYNVAKVLREMTSLERHPVLQLAFDRGTLQFARRRIDGSGLTAWEGIDYVIFWWKQTRKLRFQCGKLVVIRLVRPFMWVIGVIVEFSCAVPVADESSGFRANRHVAVVDRDGRHN